MLHQNHFLREPETTTNHLSHKSQYKKPKQAELHDVSVIHDHIFKSYHESRASSTSHEIISPDCLARKLASCLKIAHSVLQDNSLLNMQQASFSLCITKDTFSESKSPVKKISRSVSLPSLRGRTGF